MTEIWKDVIGYEGYYQISNLGRVLSLERYVPHRDGKVYLRKSRILKTFTGTDYVRISLQKNGLAKYTGVHRLIAEAFIPNPGNKPQVNHINGIKTDNRIENLEWATSSENLRHAFAIGLKDQRGEKNPGCIFSSSQIREIRSFKGKASITVLAKKFGACRMHIWDILNYKIWTHI